MKAESGRSPEGALDALVIRLKPGESCWKRTTNRERYLEKLAVLLERSSNFLRSV